MTTTKLTVPFPLMRYDHTMPLLEGRVEVEGVELKPVQTPAMVFRDIPELRQGDFGLCDLNLGYVLPAIEAGWQLVGLPVFPKRKPFYTYIFCRTDRGINSPADLAGKRIGSGSLSTALTIWARGFLRHRHGVDVSTMTWVVSMSPDVFPNHGPAMKVEPAASKKTPVQSLLDGGVDAIITDISDGKAFEALESSPRVRRLFPNYMEEDKRLHRDTGIYAPVHQIVMSKKLDRQHPELAGKLFAAFERAKQVAYEDILNDRGGFSVVYLRERFVEQTREWGDPWRYGLRANKAAFDTYMDFNVEQGVIGKRLSYDQVLAAGTLDT